MFPLGISTALSQNAVKGIRVAESAVKGVRVAESSSGLSEAPVCRTLPTLQPCAPAQGHGQSTNRPWLTDRASGAQHWLQMDCSSTALISVFALGTTTAAEAWSDCWDGGAGKTAAPASAHMQGQGGKEKSHGV